MVLYQFDDNINSDHIGIFEEWEEEGSTFTTIEGNTSSTSFSNGGLVMRQLAKWITCIARTPVAAGSCGYSTRTNPP
jgi:hypothetical protein